MGDSMLSFPYKELMRLALDGPLLLFHANSKPESIAAKEYVHEGDASFRLNP
jgi:hypothetical protein